MTEKRRIALIGCGKLKKYTYDQKRGGRVLPAELYCSDLFKKRVAYIEGRGLDWFVLSARFGLWPSNREHNPVEGSEIGHRGTEPYNFRLSELPQADQAAWFSHVTHHIVEQLWEPYLDAPMNPDELVVEIHAGSEYADKLEQMLRIVGVQVDVPVRGLGIGEQLAWYKERIKPDESREPLFADQ